jgi:hypothetical protein
MQPVAAQNKPGAAISHTSGLARNGAIWQSFWTFTPAALLAGHYQTSLMLNWW